MTHNCNTDDRIYDTNTGWQADPSTGLNLVHGKTADTPVDDNRITTVRNRWTAPGRRTRRWGRIAIHF